MFPSVSENISTLSSVPISTISNPSCAHDHMLLGRAWDPSPLNNTFKPTTVQHVLVYPPSTPVVDQEPVLSCPTTTSLHRTTMSESPLRDASVSLTTNIESHPNPNHSTVSSPSIAQDPFAFEDQDPGQDSIADVYATLTYNQTTFDLFEAPSSPSDNKQHHVLFSNEADIHSIGEGTINDFIKRLKSHFDLVTLDVTLVFRNLDNLRIHEESGIACSNDLTSFWYLYAELYPNGQDPLDIVLLAEGESSQYKLDALLARAQALRNVGYLETTDELVSSISDLSGSGEEEEDAWSEAELGGDDVPTAAPAYLISRPDPALARLVPLCSSDFTAPSDDLLETHTTCLDSTTGSVSSEQIPVDTVQILLDASHPASTADAGSVKLINDGNPSELTHLPIHCPLGDDTSTFIDEARPSAPSQAVHTGVDSLSVSKQTSPVLSVAGEQCTPIVSIASHSNPSFLDNEMEIVGHDQQQAMSAQWHSQDLNLDPSVSSTHGFTVQDDMTADHSELGISEPIVAEDGMLVDDEGRMDQLSMDHSALDILDLTRIENGMLVEEGTTLDDTLLDWESTGPSVPVSSVNNTIDVDHVPSLESIVDESVSISPSSAVAQAHIGTGACGECIDTIVFSTSPSLMKRVLDVDGNVDGLDSEAHVFLKRARTSF